MIDIYRYLQRKNKKDVIILGRAYAIDKTGFSRFAEKTWQDDEKIVRAVVSVAYLLFDRNAKNEKEVMRQLGNLYSDFETENGNKLLQAIVKFYDNGRVQVYRGIKLPSVQMLLLQKLKNYEKITLLQTELRKVDRKVIPLLSDDTIALLKKYDGKPVILSMYKKKRKTPEKVYQIKLKGQRPHEFSISLNGGSPVHLVSELGGVAIIKDAETGKVLFENNTKNMTFANRLTKLVYLYGYDDAKRIVSRRIDSLSRGDAKGYLSESDIKNKAQIERAKSQLKKSDIDEFNL